PDGLRGGASVEGRDDRIKRDSGARNPVAAVSLFHVSLVHTELNDNRKGDDRKRATGRELGVWSQESEVRSQESEVRSQESERVGIVSLRGFPSPTNSTESRRRRRACGPRTESSSTTRSRPDSKYLRIEYRFRIPPAWFCPSSRRGRAYPRTGRSRNTSLPSKWWPYF